MTSLRSLQLLILSTLIVGLTACTNSTSESVVMYDQVGNLAWHGSPAVDGAGMLFEVDDKAYGVPGSLEDYDHLIPDGEYSVRINADFEITGKKTARGWGAEFPEIKFLRIELAD